jgi:hypothetical protein
VVLLSFPPFFCFVSFFFLTLFLFGKMQVNVETDVVCDRHKASRPFRGIGACQLSVDRHGKKKTAASLLLLPKKKKSSDTSLNPQRLPRRDGPVDTPPQ